MDLKILKASDQREKVNEVIMNDVETSMLEMDELWIMGCGKEYPWTMNTTTKEHRFG